MKNVINEETNNIIEDFSKKYSSILLVKEPKTGKQLALKKINKKETTEESIRQFLITTEKLNSNENFLHFYDYYETDEYYIILNELCDDNLNNLLSKQITINNKPYDEKQIFFFLAQLNTLIKEIDEKKIMHGNLCLNNILINYNTKTTLKLGDFLVGHQSLQNKINSKDLDTIPPEVFIDKKLHPQKSDVFSLGMIICLLLGEKHPYIEEANRNEISLYDFYCTNYRMGSFEPELKNIKDVELNALVKKMILINPFERINWKDYLADDFFVKGSTKYLINIKKNNFITNQETLISVKDELLYMDREKDKLLKEEEKKILNFNKFINELKEQHRKEMKEILENKNSEKMEIEKDDDDDNENDEEINYEKMTEEEISKKIEEYEVDNIKKEREITELKKELKAKKDIWDNKTLSHLELLYKDFNTENDPNIKNTFIDQTGNIVKEEIENIQNNKDIYKENKNDYEIIYKLIYSFMLISRKVTDEEMCIKLIEYYKYFIDILLEDGINSNYIYKLLNLYRYSDINLKTEFVLYTIYIYIEKAKKIINDLLKGKKTLDDEYVKIFEDSQRFKSMFLPKNESLNLYIKKNYTLTINNLNNFLKVSNLTLSNLIDSYNKNQSLFNIEKFILDYTPVVGVCEKNYKIISELALNKFINFYKELKYQKINNQNEIGCLILSNIIKINFSMLENKNYDFCIDLYDKIKKIMPENLNLKWFIELKNIGKNISNAYSKIKDIKNKGLNTVKTEIKKNISEIEKKFKECNKEDFISFILKNYPYDDYEIDLENELYNFKEINENLLNYLINNYYMSILEQLNDEKVQIVISIYNYLNQIMINYL